MNLDIKQRIEQIKNGEVPEGYTNKYHIKPDSWKDEPLNMFFYKVKDKNHEKRYNTVFTNSAANGVIPQNEYFEKDIANEENIDGYYIVNAEDYIYNPRISEKAPYGPINQNQTGYTGIASPLYTVFTKKENICVCDEYVRYYLSSTEWNKYIYSVANYGARFDRMNISDSDFMKMPIALPQIEEQKKIAEILMQCDKIIDLYEKEIEELQKLKKIYLKKMFPRKDTNIPEIRFSEFTESWEQIKLREMGSLKNGMSFSKDAMDKGYPFVNLQNIFGKNVVDISDLGKAEASEQQLKEYSLEKGDVLFVRSSVKLEGVGEAALVPQTLENTTYSGFVIRFRDEVGLDDGYKRFVFSTKPVRDQIMSQATNSANKNVSQTVLGNLDIPIPKYEEQRKIGDYFKNLDQLIALHQCKLDEKKKHKKSLMQLLLTGIVRVDV